jgi:hypothetical protein
MTNEYNPFPRKGCECDRCDRPLRDFIQVDGWANVEPGDPIMVPDTDGDVLMRGYVREPQRSGTTVRILVAADAERGDVLRVIRKQLEWLEDEYVLRLRGGPEMTATPDDVDCHGCDHHPTHAHDEFGDCNEYCDTCIDKLGEAAEAGRAAWEEWRRLEECWQMPAAEQP